MNQKSIHQRDALRLLEDGKPHRIKVWKMSTGDILTYQDVLFVSAHRRGGTHKVKFPHSKEIREFRDVCMFEIDNLKIYL